MLALSFRFHKNVYYITILALLILAIALWLPKHVTAARQDTVATALLADMVITFPLAYYFFIIRKLGLKKWRLLFVVSCCCAVAYMILPAHQQYYILQLRKLIVLAELSILVYAATQARKIITEYKLLQKDMPDTAYNLQHSFCHVLGNTRAVRIFASEITLLRFGVLCWRKAHKWPASALKFTVHRQSGYITLLSVLLFVCLTELTGMHLVVVKYSRVAAYILLSVSLYGIIFLTGDLSAILKNPVIVDGNRLLLRVGLRWQAKSTLNNILTIEKLHGDFKPTPNCFNGAVIKSSTNILITFKKPVIINRLYRAPIETKQLAMSIDEINEFTEALQPTDK